MTKLIEAAPYDRDPYGYWTHPDVPDFDEDNVAFAEWMMLQGFDFVMDWLENEPENHPAAIKYFNGDPDCSEWSPVVPLGVGWFCLSIHDTDDGPVWIWVRRVAAEDDEPHCHSCQDTGIGTNGPDSKCYECPKKGGNDEP